MTHTPSTRTPRKLPSLILIFAALAATTGCGSSAKSSTSNAPAAAPSASSGANGANAAAAPTTTSRAAKPAAHAPARTTVTHPSRSATTATTTTRSSTNSQRAATSSPKPASGSGKLHLETSRVHVSVPASGQTVTSNTAQLPPGLSKYLAYLQLAAANGHDSKPARLGQPLVFSEGGKPQFSISLGGHYDVKSGLLSLSLYVKKLASGSTGAKPATVLADVTIGYRA